MSKQKRNKPCVKWHDAPKPCERGRPILYGHRMHGGDGSQPGTVEEMLELWKKDAGAVIEGRRL
jgi:hypothetical protein